MTEVILFENKALKEKMGYIKDLCDEAIGEDDITNALFIFDKIKDICDNKTCNNCKWWQKEDITQGNVCVCDKSDHCADWTNAQHSCKKFERK